MAVIREREVLTDVLRKYRDLPCLWDRSNEFYNIKGKRMAAHAQLLELYRVYDPKITMIEFKKKIENMRTTYRRIHVRVLKARAQGLDFEPTLWYYDEFRFLHESASDQTYSDYEQLDQDENEDDMEEVDYLKTESRESSPLPTKKRKSNYVFLKEEDGTSVTQTDLSTIVDHNFSNVKNNVNVNLSTEFFGKTVASQLDELQPLQRYIAEKIISEVIFYARLEKLCPETSISLNND